MEELIQQLRELADRYADTLSRQIAIRKEEMKTDDTSHYLVYGVLGIPADQGQLIDEYQNTGRFLYKYAGSFLEEAATLCLKFAHTKGLKTRVDNTSGMTFPLKTVAL